MILLEIRSSPARSIEALAVRLNKLRPSVSRSLKLLREDGLVMRDHGAWRLTERGEAEAAVADQQLDELREVASAAAKMLSGSHMPAIQDALKSIRSSQMVFDHTEMQSVMAAVARQRADVQRLFEASSSTTQLARAVAAFNDTYAANVTRAIEPLLQFQQHHTELMTRMVESVRAPAIEAMLRAVNLGIASAIEDSFSLRAHQLVTRASWSAYLPTLSAELRSITGALTTFAAEDLQQLVSPNADEFVRSAAWFAAPPPVSTARYTHAVRLGVDASAFDVERRDIAPRGSAELAAHLRDMGPEYIVKYEGMWAAFDSRHPDFMRHVAISGRELIRGVLQYFIPDADLDSDDRRSLIKPRIRGMLGGSDSGADWVWHFAQGAVGFYRKFNAYAHDDPQDEESLRAMVVAVDGMLQFLIVQAKRTIRR